MKYIMGLLLLSLAVTGTAQQNTSDSCRYTKVDGGYLLVLRKGDSVIRELEKMVQQEMLQSGNFSGLGFLSAVRFGYFNPATKTYEPKDFTNVELAGLTGSIAWEENEVSLHLHGVVGDRQMETHSGHILSAVVGTGSVEIFINFNTQPLSRKTDPATGAKVLQVNCPAKKVQVAPFQPAGNQ